MLKRSIVCSVLAAVALGGVSTALPASADAAPKCADVQVVFARGTAETAPPLGVTGIAFKNSLDDRIKRKDVRVEAVHYRASDNFRDKVGFAETFVQGVKTAQNRVKQIAAACPSTDIVVGGYSQGAALAAYSVSDSYRLPADYAKYQAYAPKPLPADVASHVKAVVLFAPPSNRFLRDAGAPAMEVGKAYRAKTVSYCIPTDTVCDGSPLQVPTGVHLLYPVNGTTAAAADYVARRI